MRVQTVSKAQVWSGRIMAGFVILFMLFDAIIKFIKPQVVIQTTVNELGYAEHHIIIHGVLALVATVLYAIPRTSLLGAVLLTAHFGGAIASHLRIDSPLFSHTLFPVYVGIFTWAGVLLRQPELRRFFPLTTGR